MAKDVITLFKKMPKDAQKRALKKARRIIIANQLARLREEWGMTQSDIAKILGVQQAAVSRIENREDIRVSTLVNYLTALGGKKIRLLAEFDGKKKEIAVS